MYDNEYDPMYEDDKNNLRKMAKQINLLAAKDADAKKRELYILFPRK